MMESIKSYSLILCVVSIFCTLFEMLIPAGKMSKNMYITTSLFAVLAVLAPLSSLFKNFNSDYKNLFKKTELKNTSKILDSIDSEISYLAKENIEEIIKLKLKKLDVNPKKIEIFMDIKENPCIVMIKSKIYIESEFMNHKPKIISKMLEMGISTEVFEVWKIKTGSKSHEYKH